MSVTADALNSALLHSLWQDAIVGLLLWGTLIAMRRASANARYIVCCAALGLMAALPVVTTLVLSERGYERSTADAGDSHCRADQSSRQHPTH